MSKIARFTPLDPENSDLQTGNDGIGPQRINKSPTFHGGGLTGFTGISKKDLLVLTAAFLPVWLGLERTNVGFVAIFGLVVFFFWLYRQKNSKTAFFGGLFWGFLCMG